MALRPYVVGNWKMNGTRAMLAEARAIDRSAQRLMKVEVALAPPFTLIHAVHREAEQIGVGAQDCHPSPDGAFTTVAVPRPPPRGMKKSRYTGSCGMCSTWKTSLSR